MKYMLMILDDEQALAALPQAKRDELAAAHGVVSQELRSAGKLVGAHRLRPAAEAATLRPAGDAWVVTDGPFAEAREALGGFYLIDAASKDEAIEWAKKLPLVDGGAVEVRPARTGAQWPHALRGKRKYVVLFVADLVSPTLKTKGDVYDAIDNHYGLSLELATQGKFVGSRALESPADASTVRAQGARRLVTDGPFAEAREVVAGYFVIACDSRDEAIEWAKQVGAGSDAVEVRPVWETS